MRIADEWFVLRAPPACWFEVDDNNGGRSILDVQDDVAVAIFREWLDAERRLAAERERDRRIEARYAAEAAAVAAERQRRRSLFRAIEGGES